MKITNAFFEKNNTQESPLIKLCKCNGLPAKVSYWLSRLLQKLEPLNTVYNGERKKLIEKWCDKEDGKPKEESGQYKITEHVKEFNDEYAELLSIELAIDILVIEIPIEKMPDCHDCEQEKCPQYKRGLLNSFDYSQLVGIIDFKEE